ncbi:post-segregation antitoxin (ccd killing protein) [Sphaerotilus mobilis]|uniref:Post-segregation antitoxin (Ccd killing protein) n=2 Tax=Sphaerotilus mobilis TaxID=47994 RepID=A0A4Q7LBR4_9BURK|nr:type II toxin-antitoxin system CcdA family antitoxin [Sphaerotilus mobilis]RZS47504.1 post-segregation antitoxin (ccd killing protein) [Sphaerotilus mobilis]
MPTAHRPRNEAVVPIPVEARDEGAPGARTGQVGHAAAGTRLQEQWLTDNQVALQSSNAFVERHGLPLSRYRNF